jgi:hypothetical protein
VDGFGDWEAGGVAGGCVGDVLGGARFYVALGPKSQVNTDVLYIDRLNFGVKFGHRLIHRASLVFAS